jgi:hypothetical protein
MGADEAGPSGMLSYVSLQSFGFVALRALHGSCAL